MISANQERTERFGSEYKSLISHAIARDTNLGATGSVTATAERFSCCHRAAQLPRYIARMRATRGRLPLLQTLARAPTVCPILSYPMPCAVLDAFFQLGLFDDPLEVGWVTGRDFVVALAAVLAKMKPGMKRGLA